MISNKSSDPKLGILKPSESGKKEIWVLGNSFIGSSQIGSFLNVMLQGTYTLA